MFFNSRFEMKSLSFIAVVAVAIQMFLFVVHVSIIRSCTNDQYTCANFKPTNYFSITNSKDIHIDPLFIHLYRCWQCKAMDWLNLLLGNFTTVKQVHQVQQVFLIRFTRNKPKTSAVNPGKKNKCFNWYLPGLELSITSF